MYLYCLLTMDRMCFNGGCLCVSVVPGEVKNVLSPGVIGHCEPPDVGAGDQTQIRLQNVPGINH